MEKQIVGMAPVDTKEGVLRITETPSGVVTGGTAPQHERMTEVMVRVEEGLARSGKSVNQCSPAELADRVAEADARVSGRGESKRTIH